MRRFAPQWTPLFWELGGHEAAELLNSQEAFDQFLAVLRMEEATATDFEPILRGAFTHLQQTQENRVFLSDMLHLVASWAFLRRPDSEYQRWLNVAEDVVQDRQEKERIKAMPQTMLERTWNEAIAKGKLEGKAEGAIETSQRLLLRAGTKKLNEPTPEQAQQITECTTLETLETWLDRVADVTTWAAVLETPPNTATSP